MSYVRQSRLAACEEGCQGCRGPGGLVSWFAEYLSIHLCLSIRTTNLVPFDFSPSNLLS